MKPFPLSNICKLIEPGPVVMVTTSYGKKDNVMTMAWHTMMEFTPALIGCVISENDFTFGLLKKSKECVISIPTVELAPKVVKVGNISGKNIDKFEKFGLTKMPASKIKASLIAECYANLECKIYDTTLMKKYNFLILEVVAAWIDANKRHPKTIHHSGTGHFTVDGKEIKLPWKL